jgi:hypothetical protein
MNNNIVNLWEQNNEILRNYFKTTIQENYQSYKSLVKLITEYILNNHEESYDIPKYDIEHITIIDDGDYQGTQLFLIPEDTYQPSASNYLVTYTYYGSCSGCDTLQGIHGYEDDLPNEEQVNDYMSLCLHLIQRMKSLYEN